MNKQIKVLFPYQNFVVLQAFPRPFVNSGFVLEHFGPQCVT